MCEPGEQVGATHVRIRRVTISCGALDLWSNRHLLPKPLYTPGDMGVLLWLSLEAVQLACVMLLCLVDAMGGF